MTVNSPKVSNGGWKLFSRSTDAKWLGIDSDFYCGMKIHSKKGLYMKLTFKCFRGYQLSSVQNEGECIDSKKIDFWEKHW